MYPQTNWILGNPPRLPIPGLEGFYMHVGSSIQHTVAFIGYEDSSAPGGISCVGTGVLVHHQGVGYLVTARHVVEPIGDAPFLVRVNRAKSGGSNMVLGEKIKWYFHPDETVDLAAMPFAATVGRGFECLYIPETDFMSEEVCKEHGIDVGDLCYTVGLFRYLTGNDRNLPVVFTGNVALWNAPDIPIWNQFKNKAEHVHGHLIQCYGLQGASGSPVFGRAGLQFGPLPLNDGTEETLVAALNKKWLLGIFQGAWFLPPDELLRAEIGAKAGDTVPVGLGIVVPCSRLLELFESDEVREMRSKQKPLKFAQQVTLEQDRRQKSKSDESANPTHKEDFSDLLREAARRREPKD
jgi:hypothetical protein